MNIVRLLFVICMGFCSLQVAAQKYSTTNKQAIRLYEQANGLSSARQFDQAKECLYEAVRKDPNFVEAYIRLAGIHNLFQDYDKARNALQKAVDIKPADKDMAGAYNLLGDLYMLNSGFDKAAENYQRVITVQPTDQNLLIKAEARLKCAKFASNAVKNPVDVKPVKMEPSINNFHAQGYPMLTADNQTMMFYVLRTPESRGDIMITNKQADGHWTHALSLSDNINTDNGDEGAPTMSADGRSMVFTACQRQGSVGGCDLYISYREGQVWSEPENLGREVNSPSWDSEPSISADGRTLYFSSDRPVAKGRKDRNIWMAKKGTDGKWMKAVALAAPINTIGNEVSPFIHANNSTLYFASDYHPGMGGYDVFYSKRKDTTWIEPVNIGYPLNTTDNDGTIFVTADGMKGYYSVYERTAKVNSASMIYEFDMPVSLKEENKTTYSKGKITDKVTSKPLRASVELLDVATGELVQSVKSDGTDGSYLLILTEGKQYALRVYATGYLFESRSFDFRKPSDFNPLTLDFQLSPLKSGASVVLNNIFFPSNSAILNPESSTELNKVVEFLGLNPTVKIELSGHTDDVGSDADNLSLSEKRAKSVYEFLVGKGVAKERLVFKGYGETKPKQPNTNEANRALNRRIEFKVL